MSANEDTDKWWPKNDDDDAFVNISDDSNDAADSYDDGREWRWQGRCWRLAMTMPMIPNSDVGDDLDDNLGDDAKIREYVVYISTVLV